MVGRRWWGSIEGTKRGYGRVAVLTAVAGLVWRCHVGGRRSAFGNKGPERFTISIHSMPVIVEDGRSQVRDALEV